MPTMDWQQVVLNGGPPCFFVEGARYCGRAKRWPGHGKPAFHKFVSLELLLDEAATAALEQERKRILEAIIAIPVTRPVEDFAEARDAWDYKADVLAAIGDDKEDQP